MTEAEKGGKTGPSVKSRAAARAAEKEARLADALRANLRRRKAQVSGRAQDDTREQGGEKTPSQG